jgi:hypothetical protein
LQIETFFSRKSLTFCGKLREGRRCNDSQARIKLLKDVPVRKSTELAKLAQIPSISQSDSLLQVDTRRPSEGLNAGGFQEFAGCSIRL